METNTNNSVKYYTLAKLLSCRKVSDYNSSTLVAVYETFELSELEIDERYIVSDYKRVETNDGERIVLTIRGENEEYNENEGKNVLLPSKYSEMYPDDDGIINSTLWYYAPNEITFIC